MLMVKRQKIIKMEILTIAIYRINITPIKIPAGFFGEEINRLILKFM